ncbi:RIMS-binding protein 3A [Striga asiatica]|uniref:RIMS-binding protein 3A n=1 Tax=Striga asiatica TaxID=4170 RepID=A0A5A7Q7F6_STRAF|nr:RIMS-binding protein 3A [Striga asiatica]
MLGIVYARSFQVAALSPVQCAVYLPEPTKVDLLSTNGLLPVTPNLAKIRDPITFYEDLGLQSPYHIPQRPLCINSNTETFLSKKRLHQSSIKSIVLLTKRPIRHRRWPANEARVLLHDQLRRGPGKEIQVKHSSDHLVCNPIPCIHNIHPIAIEQQDSMSQPTRRSEIHVERVGPIQVEIHGGAGDVGVPEGECLVVLQLEGALRVLPDAVEVGGPRRQRGGELEVLILEYEVGGGIAAEGRGVEYGFAGGAAADGESKRRGVVEGEEQVRARERDLRRRWVEEGGAEAAAAGENVVGDFPAPLAGVSDSDSQTEGFAYN